MHWSLLDWVMNWQKPLASSANLHRVLTIQPGHLFLNQEGPFRTFPFFCCCSFCLLYLFIIHFSWSCFSLEDQCVSNYLWAIHYRWHPPHCTAKILGVQKKMGFAFTLCFSVLMKRKIEERNAFIFWQNAMLGHEYLLSLSSSYLLSEEYLKGSWSCLREQSDSLIWVVNHLEEAFTIQVTWDKLIIPSKGSNSQDIYTTTVKLLTILISAGMTVEDTAFSRSLNIPMLCGNGCCNQTHGWFHASGPK